MLDETVLSGEAHVEHACVKNNQQCRHDVEKPLAAVTDLARDLADVGDVAITVGVGDLEKPGAFQVGPVIIDHHVMPFVSGSVLIVKSGSDISGPSPGYPGNFLKRIPLPFREDV